MFCGDVFNMRKAFLDVDGLFYGFDGEKGGAAMSAEYYINRILKLYAGLSPKDKMRFLQLLKEIMKSRLS